ACERPHPAPFPTRRSSDLAKASSRLICRGQRGHRQGAHVPPGGARFLPHPRRSVARASRSLWCVRVGQGLLPHPRSSGRGTDGAEPLQSERLRAVPGGSLRMSTFVLRLDIARRTQDVFSFLADSENTPLWYEAVQAVRKLTPGPVRKGTVYEMVRRLPQGRVENEVEVSEL